MDIDIFIYGKEEEEEEEEEEGYESVVKLEIPSFLLGRFTDSFIDR
jgi:hypothetical protein